MSNVKDFLKRKDIVITPQRYLIEALGAMAQGLFASLLIGTIIKTLGQQTGLDVLVDLGGYATAMSGPAMACAIGWALHCPPLVLFSLITVGYSANALGGAGGPLAVLIIAIVASELGKAVSKETRVDILVTPLVTIFSGVGLSMLIAAPIGAAASQVGTLIMWATEQAPLVMGILVSVIVGVALTLPISSAAICAALGLTGIAGGAAVAGCCAQMIGFAVMSYKENGVGGLVSQGLGTSMLQMGNIVKNPRIWIAPTLASAITGPLATCVFHFEMNDPASGVASGKIGSIRQPPLASLPQEAGCFRRFPQQFRSRPGNSPKRKTKGNLFPKDYPLFYSEASDSGAVVHSKDLTGDPLGLVTGKKQDGVGLILGGHLGDSGVHVQGTLSGKLGVKGGDLLRGVQGGGSGAGADAVHPDALACELDGHVLGHADDGGLGRSAHGIAGEREGQTDEEIPGSGLFQKSAHEDERGHVLDHHLGGKPVVAFHARVDLRDHRFEIEAAVPEVPGDDESVQ